MEKIKEAIDERAKTLVRRELWAGLGFLLAQTLGFMRLTFWELTWDVMEPICFYVTSMYFMAGYTFFLRTSKEPCFEGFYQSRFSSQQKRLIKLHSFDIARYNELKAALPSPPSSDDQIHTSFVIQPIQQFHKKLQSLHNYYHPFPHPSTKLWGITLRFSSRIRSFSKQRQNKKIKYKKKKKCFMIKMTQHQVRLGVQYMQSDFFNFSYFFLLSYIILYKCFFLFSLLYNILLHYNVLHMKKQRKTCMSCSPLC